MPRFTATTLILLILSLALQIAGDAPVIAGQLHPHITIEPSQITFETSREACQLYRSNGMVQSYANIFGPGMRTVTYFDPASCGRSEYPFQISSLLFPLLDPGGYQWPVTVDIVIFDMAVPGNPCAGPGEELCRTRIVCTQETFGFPNVGLADFSSVCCVNQPFYAGIEFVDGTPGTVPSVAFDTGTPAVCEVWQYYTDGNWYDWPNFWTPPTPGYPVILVDGFTASNGCSPSSDLVINEVRHWYLFDATGGERRAFVELFNKSTGDLALDEYTLRGKDGGAIADLPDWTMPSKSYLRVEFGPGADDPDFSDEIATFFTQGAVEGIFPSTDDEVGLYHASQIVDFIGWSSTGGYNGGIPYTDALDAAIWNADDYADLSSMGIFSTFGLCPSGVDNNSPSDWIFFDQTKQFALGYPSFKNPIQSSPLDGSLLRADRDLHWSAITNAASYHVLIDDDPAFGSPEVSVVTTETTLPNPGLPDGEYNWQVFCDGFEGGDYSDRWGFVVGLEPPGKDQRAGTILPVPQVLQHKDSKLLCITDEQQKFNPPCKRRGCSENPADPSGLWDDEHPDTYDHITKCDHCGWYCGRAAIQMVAWYFGTAQDLTQDHISYEMLEHRLHPRNPEGDLGHNRGTWTDEEKYGLGWALNGEAIAEFDSATYEGIQNEINNGRPIVILIPGHWMVISGWWTTFSGRQMIRLVDPWPSSRHPGTGERSTSVLFESLNVRKFLALAAIPTHEGRDEFPSVKADTDNDGIRDFDEGFPDFPEQRPRRFHSKFNEVDSDSDEVFDKDEIRNYTFHDQDGFHPGHENDPLNFADIDGDSLRAEHDCDSDNDGDFDGGEDIDGDGMNPEDATGTGCTSETCQFLNTESCIMISTDKNSYKLGEPVYLVDIHGSRESHTFHAFSTYNYGFKFDCIDYEDGAPINWDGVFETDIDGHVIERPITLCLTPGQFKVFADVLSDHTYSEPDNWDPWTCFTCENDWYHGWHTAKDWDVHNPGFDWPSYEYPLVRKPVRATLSKHDAAPMSGNSDGNSGQAIQEDVAGSPPNAPRSDHCEILSYYGSPDFFYQIPSTTEADLFNQRFTPVGECTLKSISLAFYQPASTTNTQEGVTVFIWDSDSTGLPGALRAQIVVPLSQIQWFPNFTTIDLTPVALFGLIFTGDFHVGFTTNNKAEDVYAIVSDNGSNPMLRSSFFKLGEWRFVVNSEGFDVNFFITAEICCEEGPRDIIDIFTPWWWWCYEFPPPERDFQLGVKLPANLYSTGDIRVSGFPVFEDPIERSRDLRNTFAPDEALTADLNTQFGDSENEWLGFKLPNWVIDDSLVSVKVSLSLALDKAADDFYAGIRMGDSEYGWNSVFYDSIFVDLDALPVIECGDVDASARVDITDAVYVINFIFAGGPAPQDGKQGDLDCNDRCDITDAVYLINFIFANGPGPCAACP